MAKNTSAGQTIYKVFTAVGDEEINNALDGGWKGYGTPVIPVGHSEFHWLMVLRNEEAAD